MDSTALVTFVYKSRPGVRSVELYGSWDNFSCPYRMQRDVHRGRSVWSGCHSFENIICDGDRIDRLKPRSGALKQGGTYWYFYKLDDDEEACDNSKPITAACPLLPGQTLNVLDVPIEVTEPPKRVHSASAIVTFLLDSPMTTDPADRFKKVERKPPTKLPRYYCSSDALRERFDTDGRMASDTQARGISRPKNRAPSPGIRSIKRMRCNGPSYQKSGACQIDVTPEDIAMLADIPNYCSATQAKDQRPVLRPFAPCSRSSSDERPVTRAGMLTDFTKGLGLSFFGSKRKAKMSPRVSSDNDSMEYEYTQPSEALPYQYFPQYDGAFEDLSTQDPAAYTHWHMSSPVSMAFDTKDEWPLPHPNPLRASPIGHALSVGHGATTLISNIPTLDLGSHPTNNQTQVQSYPSPATTESSISGDYHPGFGPRSNRMGTGSLDMTSPTFTADTMNSTPEIRTPDRFVLHATSPSPSPSPQQFDSNAKVEDLSRRLSHLTSSEPDQDEEDDSDNESLYRSSKVDFYGFSHRASEFEGNQDDEAYTESNASCLTLKPTSRSRRVPDTPDAQIPRFTLSLPSTAGLSAEGGDVGTEFSSDVLAALGITF